MKFFDVIRERASVRKFEPAEIGRQELEAVIDAGRRAPSGYNRQPWEFVVVQDKEMIRRMGQVQSCISDAGAVIAVAADSGASKYWLEDISAAIENMLLAIVDLGYASLWVEGYLLPQENEVKQWLNVPDSYRLLALLPVGTPGPGQDQAPKRPLGEVLHWEKYGGRQ